MGGAIPSQCPACGGIPIETYLVPPSGYERGEEWSTRAECSTCADSVQWFD